MHGRKAVPKSMLGQEVATRVEQCDCPICAAPPVGSTIANILDAGAYLSEGYTPVLAGGETELKCGIGYRPNASFECEIKTHYPTYLADYKIYLPECLPKDCVKKDLTDSLGPNSTVQDMTGAEIKGDKILHGATVKAICGPDMVLTDLTLEMVKCNLGNLYTGDDPSAGSTLPTCTSGTTTSTTTSTTAAAETTTITTTIIQNKTFYTVKAKLTLDFGALPDNVTAEELANDETFVSNVEASIASGVGVDPSIVNVTGIAVITRRRLAEQPRRLAGAKLQVDYELYTTDEAAKDTIVAALDDTSAFGAKFKDELVKAEANSGRTVEVNDVVASPPEVTEEVNQVVVTQAPPTTEAPATTAAAATTEAAVAAATTKAAPAPTPLPTAEEPVAAATAAPADADDSTDGAMIGGIIGGVVGLGLLFGLLYMYKKSQKQE